MFSKELIGKTYHRRGGSNLDDYDYGAKVDAQAEKDGMYFMSVGESTAICSNPRIDRVVYARRYRDIVDYQKKMFFEILEKTHYSCSLNGLLNLFPVTCIWHDGEKLDLPLVFLIEGNHFFCHEMALEDVKMALATMEKLLPRLPVRKEEPAPRLLVNTLDNHYSYGGLLEETWPRTFDQVMTKYRSLADEPTQRWIRRLAYENSLEQRFAALGLTTPKAMRALSHLLAAEEKEDDAIMTVMADLLV